MTSCGSGPPASKTKAQICMKIDEPDIILTQLKEHANAPTGDKIYLLFHGTVCASCPQLQEKISNINLDAKLIYVSIDFTWVFILSRHLQLQGVPTLVVFIQGVPKFAREGNSSILEYLHGNAKGSNK